MDSSQKSLPGPEFYDHDDVITNYMASRARPDNPNDTLEKPVLLELLGDLTGKRILDLGCGDATFGVEAFQHGCAAYLGVEGSRNMTALAMQNLSGTPGQVIRANLETWEYPHAAFELAISRLALHYLSSLDTALSNVHQALMAGGRFVFSVEHPVITACDRAWRGQGPRQHWIVDDYFDTGLRETPWLGRQVVKYHHTVEDYCLGLQRAGFVLESLREARPQPARFTSEKTYRRRMKIPLFLLLAGKKA